MKFIRPSSNSNFNCHSPKGIKLTTGLSLDLSNLREHKFRYNFQDTLNLDTDLWGWHQNCNSLPTSLSKSFRWKEALLDNLQSIAKTFPNLWIFHLAFLEIMMHQITCILNVTIQYILATILKNLASLLSLLSLLSQLKHSYFSIRMLTLPSPTTLHAIFNDNWLFVSFFYYCQYCLSRVFFT